MLPNKMIDNQEPQIHSEVNTNFTEQRALISEEAKVSAPMITPRFPESHMPDETWLAKTQLTKPVMIGQYVWDTSLARNSQIASFEFPQVLVTNDSLMSRTLRMYSFFRITPVIKLQINSTQFHQGQLIMSFDPFGQAASVTSATPTDSTPVCNIYYATGLPNVKLMASEADPVELQIPFVHPRNYLTTNSSNGYDIMGTVRLQVLNPLKAAAGATSSLTATIWIYAKDASVHVPINYHEPLIPELTSSPSGLIDDIGGIVKEGSNLIGNLASGNFRPALTSGRGLVNKVGDLFGFDYPTMPIHLDKTISPSENLAIVKGISRSHRLAMDPLSGYIAPPDLFNEQDMDLLRLAQTPMLIGQISWDTTMDAGKQLFSTFVNPTLVHDAGTYDDTTYLAFVSKLFTYWRGGIIFDLEFVATHYHSGRVVVGFVPNFDNKNGTYSNIVTSCPNAIIDIQQTSKVSFLVPFVSATAIKEVLYADLDESVIGKLFCYVQNKLAVSNNVTGEIEINVYVRAASDFQLFVPADPQLIIDPPKDPPKSAEPSSGIELQSNRTEDATKDPDIHLSLGSGLAPSVPRFSESYSLLDLIKRFTYSRSFAVPTNNAEVFSYANQPPLQYVSPVYSGFYTEDSSVPKYIGISYLSVISRIYSIWSGSLRFKFVKPTSRGSATGLIVLHIPNYTQQSDYVGPKGLRAYVGYASTLTTLSQDNTLEVEVPYYSEYQCLLTRPTAGVAFTAYKTPLVNGVLAISAFSESSKSLERFYEFVAAGDDFRFGYPRPPGKDFRQNSLPFGFSL